MQRRIAMTDPAGRKAALKKEELEATGLFTVKEIEAIVESENVDEGKFTGSKSSVDRNSAADSGGRNAAERRSDRRILAKYYGDGGKKTAIERAKKERDEKRAARMSEEFEQLDEISQKTATKAFARRATDEFENDGDYRGDFTKSGKSKANETKRRIEKKHGKKAGQHAERAAHANTFGRKSFSMPKANEEVSFSETELKKFEEIVNSWID